MSEFTELELQAYLDEALPTESMAAIEAALRDNDALSEKLAEIHTRRDAGVHALGDIWRRHRLTCPSRQELGNFLLNVLSGETTDYIRFHLEEVGCRQCRANLDDLNNQHAEAAEQVESRRTKYFQSSAGYLHSR